MKMDKNFRKLSLSLILFRGLVELGDIIFAIIIQVQIYNIQPTGINLSILMLIRNLPIILVGTFAGTAVDYFKKSNLISVCLGLMACFVLLAGFDLSLVSQLFLMGIYRVIYAFYKPARSAILPSILEKKEILKCISYIMIVQEISTITASLLVAKFFLHSIKILITLTIICFSISIFILLIVLRPLEPQMEKKAKQGFDAARFIYDTKNGWIYLLHTKSLRILAIIVAFVWLSIGGFSSIQIIYLSTTLQMPSHWVGLSESIISIGNLAGYFLVTIAANRVKNQNQLSNKIGIGYLIASIAMFYSSEVNSFIVFSFLLIIYAIGDGFSNSIEESLEQKLPDQDQIGKSISAISSIGTIGYLLGVTLFPILTDIFSVSGVIKLSSLCMLITSVVVFKNSKILIPEKEII